MEHKTKFLADLANSLLSSCLEGYIVCSSLSKTFDLDKLLQHSKMNSLLWSFELNLILTMICKAFKQKDKLVVLAFYRALIYLR